MPGREVGKEDKGRMGGQAKGDRDGIEQFRKRKWEESSPEERFPIWILRLTRINARGLLSASHAGLI